MVRTIIFIFLVATVARAQNQAEQTPAPIVPSQNETPTTPSQPPSPAGEPQKPQELPTPTAVGGLDQPSLTVVLTPKDSSSTPAAIAPPITQHETTLLQYFTVEQQQQLDRNVINDDYQKDNFTDNFRSAILRRTLSALKLEILAAEVEPPMPGRDDIYETLVANFFRGIRAAYRESWATRLEDQLDGHYASAALIHLANGQYVRCAVMMTRREVDRDLIWLSNTACRPAWGTQEGWESARSVDFEGFYNVVTEQFEQTPRVGVGANSFKTRRHP